MEYAKAIAVLGLAGTYLSAHVACEKLKVDTTIMRNYGLVVLGLTATAIVLVLL